MIASEQKNIVLMSERQLQLIEISGLNEADLKESLANSKVIDRKYNAADVQQPTVMSPVNQSCANTMTDSQSLVTLRLTAQRLDGWKDGVSEHTAQGNSATDARMDHSHGAQARASAAASSLDLAVIL